jgi:hypothetical protein
MISSRRFALAAYTLTALCIPFGGSALGSGRTISGMEPTPLMHRVQMQGLLDLFADDGDDYGHDRHYDFDRYRESTSRKERVRDYYRMQKDMQKDYWKSQKEMQKNAIKRQRGW